MSYPSIITQPGAAARNTEPILEALSSLINPLLSDSSDTRNKTPLRILEIGSGHCTHLKAFSSKWRKAQWYPTGRNVSEVEVIRETVQPEEGSGNVREAGRLDIGIEEDWASWEEGLRRSGGAQEGEGGEGVFGGVVMINIVHCCPPDYPENVFRHFSPLTQRPDIRPLLDSKHGWIAVYSPFLADDGSYKSEADAKFDKEYIKAKDPSLGLRTIPSLSSMADKWGFELSDQRDMPKGNMWVVWRVKEKMKREERLLGF